MEIPDAEVYKTLQKVASMEPTVKRVTRFFDDDVLDKKIQKAVESGVKNCPFYSEGKAKKKINSTIKWLVTICVPVLVTILTLFATGVFAE